MLVFNLDPASCHTYFAQQIVTHYMHDHLRDLGLTLMCLSTNILYRLLALIK